MNTVPNAMPKLKKKSPPGQRVSMTVGLCGSLLIHTLIFLSLAGLSSLPSVGFQIELPAAVEFGLTEKTALMAPQPDRSSRNPIKPESTVASLESKTEVVSIEKEKKRQKKKKEQSRDAGTESSGEKGKFDDKGLGKNLYGRPDSGTPQLAAFAPPGTQLALRLDMQRVRRSPLAAEVRTLLQAVPDWNLILDGSGIDPVSDLNRLFVASPNLLRSRLVIAGQYLGGRAIAHKAVASLAALRGKEAAWRSESGIDVAPWFNRDETERIIALVGPETFAITRPSDLPRVLAVARGLAERRARRMEEEPPPASALLEMQEGETLSLSVEGARQFVRGELTGIPSRLSISVIEDPEKQILVTGEGLYDSERQAEQAKGYWQGIRKKVMAHPLVVFIDMNQPLANATVDRIDTRLVVRTILSYKHALVLFGLLRTALMPSPASTLTLKETSSGNAKKAMK
ncbi:MAG: hypothetical protein JXA30_09860 [Deltaproteobacteria bacterium]|nr:hypothetical protein [Deltaproteobacteria bacterium]